MHNLKSNCIIYKELCFETYDLLELPFLLIDPGHEKKCLMSYENNKGADQPVHLHSLISALFVFWLDSTKPLVSMYEIASL